MMSPLCSVCKCQEHSYLRLEHKDILRYLHRYLSTFRFEKEAVHAVWLGRSSGPSASPDIHLQHHEPHCVVSQSNGGERFRYAQWRPFRWLLRGVGTDGTFREARTDTRYIRFSFCVIAGFIQTFLLNGPSTNESGCEISFQSCWAWGLTINGYFGLLFAIVFVLAIPICWLKELEDTHVPRHTASFFFKEIWLILQNMTTFYILIFILGIQTLTNFTSNANIQLQYYVIKLTNFQAGIDTVTTYAGLAYAIWLFQTYMINRDWHITQYTSVLLAALLGLVWIAPYYNLGGTQNGWFTIFIDLDTVSCCLLLICCRCILSYLHPFLLSTSCSNSPKVCLRCCTQ